MKTPSHVQKVLLGMLIASPAAFSEDAFYDAFSSGKVKFDSRLRYEGVSQDNDPKDASGLTLRTRLGYKTGEFYNTSGFVEMSNVQVVGGIGDYAPRKSGYSKIADPEITRLNQAYLKTSPFEGLSVTTGRQRIILDNARFVGNVGWRQTEQTFDAVRVQYDIAGFKTDVSYIWDVKGITETFTTEAKDIIANLSYSTDVGKITGYYYSLEHGDNLDLDTYGARFAGKYKINSDVALNYSAEYAQQTSTAKSTDFEASYLHATFGAAYKGIGLMAGYEVLGSDEGLYGFNTPLATKHAYNGWADIFLVTPASGLQDFYIKASGKALGIKLAAVYHDYSADEGGDDLGSEINLVAVKPFAKKYKVGAKYANYSASEESGKFDTQKFWLWASMAF